MNPIFLSICNSTLPALILILFPGKWNNESYASKKKKDTAGKSPGTPVYGTVYDEKDSTHEKEKPAV
jgi:hypothetical protein